MQKFKLSEYIGALRENGLLTDENTGGSAERTVDHLTYDSRAVKDGTLFVCKGIGFKEEYLDSALDAGAFAYVCEAALSAPDKPYIQVSDVTAALAVLAALYYNHPEHEVTVLGITGTKGKSTTSYYVKYILDDYAASAGKPETAIVSSIDTFDGVSRQKSFITTPESLELYEHIRNAADSGLENLVMEISSQAFKKHRVLGIDCRIGAFLNISEDHISSIEHPDYEEYLSCKLQLFDQTETAIVNLGTNDLDRVLSAAGRCDRVVTFGRTPDADFYAYDIRKAGISTLFRVRSAEFDEEFELTMPGLFNVDNALAAIAFASLLGVPYENMYNGLSLARASGRMETFSNDSDDVIAIVDYAHNRLSFQSLFESIRTEYPGKRILAVFGCPGGHALNRRRDLGEVAGQYAAMSYITEDDPRFESVGDICREVAQHVDSAGGKYKIIEDRESAIREAIRDARAEGNTVVVITGKGTEKSMFVKGEWIDCKSDIECVKENI